MYPTIQEKAIVDAAEKIMIETMARYDPSHDQYHVQRVRKSALTLANSIDPTPDLLVVELAALLHDVLDKKYVSAEEAADPFTFFLPFFQSMTIQYGIDLISNGRGQTIARVIDNVSWSTEKKLRAAGEWTAWHDSCVELHCVQDADRLDAIGAFGIMRCAAYSTVTNRPLHTPSEDPQHAHTSIQHFHDKLLHIRDRLKTGPGRKLGDKRHKVLLDFLTSVQEEYEGSLL
ncbi:hypothetical protein CPB84DRAFT_1227284 [Gymnopilus junonius]|uniref:HD/PDEase domain-containing protein n=1 Tax=Gymnopilus junonius TaxID=109634 RepID=A0A9P5NVG3_GYMJU|nr:hypothetical protein CPB84DRAFT_1227284 [Gymnopilus junonius]